MDNLIPPLGYRRRYPPTGEFRIRFGLKHLFAFVFAASLATAIASAIAESRSWSEVKRAEFLVERAVLNMGYDVAEKFDVADDGSEAFLTSTPAFPYKHLLVKRVESRTGFFGRTFSVNQFLRHENEIDVRIECISDFSIVDTGEPRIVIYDNGAPSNECLIQIFETHLDQVFAQFSTEIETERKKTPDDLRIGG